MQVGDLVRLKVINRELYHLMGVVIEEKPNHHTGRIDLLVAWASFYEPSWCDKDDLEAICKSAT